MEGQAVSEKYTLDLLAPHTKYYLPDGTQVPGVTTVLGATLPKHALVDWAWKLGMEGRVRVSLAIGLLQLFERRHKGLRHVFAAEEPKMATGVG